MKRFWMMLLAMAMFWSMLAGVCAENADFEDDVLFTETVEDAVPESEDELGENGSASDSNWVDIDYSVLAPEEGALVDEQNEITSDLPEYLPSAASDSIGEPSEDCDGDFAIMANNTEQAAADRILIYNQNHHNAAGGMNDGQQRLRDLQLRGNNKMGSNSTGAGVSGCGIYAMAHAYQWLNGGISVSSSAELLQSFINIDNAPWEGNLDEKYGNLLNAKRYYGVSWYKSLANTSESIWRDFFNNGGAAVLNIPGHYICAVGMLGSADTGTGEMWFHIVDSSCGSTFKRLYSAGTNAYSFSDCGIISSSNGNGFWRGDDYFIPLSGTVRSGMTVRGAYIPGNSNGNGNGYSDKVSNADNQQSASSVYRVVTRDGLNMRASASTGGRYITTLWPDTTVAVTQKANANGYTWGYGTSSNGYTGWIVVDNNWTKLVSSPIAHTHTPVAISGKAATCTETGLTEGSKCSACGEILTAQENIPAKGHSAVAVPGVPATCTQAGMTEGSRCSVCGMTLTAQEYIPAKGHSAVAVPGRAATCTQAGMTEGSRCSVCGMTLTAQEYIPAKGHSAVVIPGKPATTTSTGLTEGSQCSFCGEILVAQQITPVIDPPELLVKKNTTLEVRVNDSVQIAVPGKEVKSYKSNKSQIASVSKDGVVTAKAGGTAKITITLTNKKTLTLTVKVTDPNAPKAISISAGGKGTTIKKGNTLQLTATVTNPAGAKATFTWTSSNPKVATVGKKTGKVKGVGKGTAIITATPQNGVKKTIKIKVK